ncbi:MAG TPA: hypothetical protein VMI32_21470 [Candidatus Solibacter sp.]|nr:hypothetical protein [Candidatus Solibacter sp.]
MRLQNPFQKLGASTFVLGVAMFFVQDALHAGMTPLQEWQDAHQPASQQQSQQTSSPSAAANSQASTSQSALPGELPVKRRKIWTNGDVVSLRTPADNYQLEQETKRAANAQAAAREAAAKAGAKSGKELSLEINLPATAEETEKMLKNAQSDIQEETDVLDNLHKELLNTPAGEQAQKQKEIDRITANLATQRTQLKALEDHLQALRPKPQGENPPAQPPPPSL